jgi:hypothetical protein
MGRMEEFHKKLESINLTNSYWLWGKTSVTRKERWDAMQYPDLTFRFRNKFHYKRCVQPNPIDVYYTSLLHRLHQCGLQCPRYLLIS